MKRRKCCCRLFILLHAVESSSLLDTSKWTRIPQNHTKIMLILFTFVTTILLFIDDTCLFKGGTTIASLRHHPVANWNDISPVDNDALVSCRVPRFHPLDKGILAYYRSPPSSLLCKKREVMLSSMHLDSGELEILPISSTYKCFMEDVVRHGDNDIQFGRPRQVLVGRHKLRPTEAVQAIRVYCQNIIGLTIYTHIHLVPPKVSVKRPPRSQKYQSNNNSEGNEQRQNVFIFGVDSLSRLAALRLLPRTYNFLVEELSAVVLRSHHKVGENTFPNLLAILSGDRKTHPADTPHKEKQYFDEWPLIWKRFSDEGYETLYAEDFPQFSTFNYLADGFIRPPTNHYLRPFWLALEKTMLSKTSSLLCYGAKPKYQLQLEYVKYFLQKKRSHPYFAFSFLVEISHEYQEYVGAADRDFVEILEILKDEVSSGKTLLIVLSDHGHRFDPIRETPQGHIEERLPFVAIATANIKQKAILSENSHLLTSHYDIYEVLRSVLQTSKPRSSKFGIDILRKNVLKNRTCAEAGVLEVYCTCGTNSNSLDDHDYEKIRALAGKAVIFINKLLNQNALSQLVCKRLLLKSLRSSFNVGPNKVITFETTPGDAVFELRFGNWNEPLNETMFSRINRYGVPCIPDQILRKYCYCNDYRT